MKSSFSGFVLFGVLSTCAGCGGETPEPQAPTHETEAKPVSAHPSMSTSAEVGALDEGKVTQTFHGALKDLQACLASGAKRNELEGGDIAFLVKVDTSGRIVHAHAEKSTIGDRDTEKCMLSALRKRDWPPAEGGDVGLARNSFGFDMPNDERPPTDWDAERVASAKSDMRGKLDACKHGVSGSLTATVYVDPDGSAVTAGVATSDDSGEAAADCIVGVLKGAKYPSPGSWPAKVTFEL
ncbi:MAG TPA: AgmX/PglI C-terminal domain-containing protein [Polyangiaceae bacterium]|nr:AgmX/PglI C-terminal domain-containing protein [Polyangiaceae bacterium]